MSPVNGGFPGQCQTGQRMTVLWELDLWGHFRPILHPPVSASLLAFISTWHEVPGFQSCCGTGKAGMGIGQIKRPQNLLF